jgi:hypothetical protein
VGVGQDYARTRGIRLLISVSLVPKEVSIRVFREGIMRKRVAMLSAATALALVGAGAALSANPNEPGTPGSPNCQGQEIAFLNGLFGSMGLQGIQAVASALGFASVKDFKEANRLFCS